MLLVSGGTGGVDDTEVIPLTSMNLSESSLTCSKPGDLTTNRYGQFIRLSNGIPLLCGGVFSGQYLNDCLLYSKETNGWAPSTAQLSMGKAFAASAQLSDQKFMVFGKIIRSQIKV